MLEGSGTDNGQAPGRAVALRSRPAPAPPRRRPPRSAPGRRLRRVVLRLAVAAVLVIAVVAAAAWFSTPSTAGAASLIRAREAGTHAHPVGLSQVAPVMRQAVVATEDERFWANHGIDLVGVARAFAYDVSHASTAQGASTITEQLVKLLYLQGNDHTPWKKLEDAVMALRLGSHMTKDEILAGYLNTAYFGHGAYGVANASRSFFGIPPARLDLAQASILAGLLQAPSAYDPFAAPAAARARQAEVLRSMVRNGDITRQEGQRALTAPLRLAGGASLAPLTGVSLAPGPAVAGHLMLLGFLVIVAALAWRWAGRRLRLPLAARLSWLAVACVGLVVIFRSLQVV